MNHPNQADRIDAAITVGLACAAARVVSRIALRRWNGQLAASFEGKNRLVLRPVILRNPPDVFPQRHAPDEQQEDRDANAAIH